MELRSGGFDWAMLMASALASARSSRLAARVASSRLSDDARLVSGDFPQSR
jgi:hypothetical protein